mmetsp:Transcript_12986/g.27456  ORF Transcript_12986/g.27456 Transcript_12986/m.27456 type:complete len:287 (-) Transcript_12986:1247-2107(-)
MEGAVESALCPQPSKVLQHAAALEEHHDGPDARQPRGRQKEEGAGDQAEVEDVHARAEGVVARRQQQPVRHTHHGEEGGGGGEARAHAAHRRLHCRIRCPPMGERRRHRHERRHRHAAGCRALQQQPRHPRLGGALAGLRGKAWAAGQQGLPALRDGLRHKLCDGERAHRHLVPGDDEVAERGGGVGHEAHARSQAQAPHHQHSARREEWLKLRQGGNAELKRTLHPVPQGAQVDSRTQVLRGGSGDGRTHNTPARWSQHQVDVEDHVKKAGKTCDSQRRGGVALA